MTDVGRRAARTGLLVCLIVLLYLLFVLTPIGQRIDQLGTGLAGWLPALAPPGQALRTPLTVVSILAAVVVIVDALLRRRVAAALSAGAMMALSLALNTVLRDVVLFRPEYGAEAGFHGNSFPSGHVAVSVTSACVVVALWRWRRPRRFTLLVALLPAAVAVSSLVAHAHRTSDVIAGAVLGAAAAQWIAGTRLPRVTPARMRALGWVSGVSVALVAAALGVVRTPLDAVGAPLLTVGILGAVASATALAMVLSPQPLAPVSASGR